MTQILAPIKNVISELLDTNKILLGTIVIFLTMFLQIINYNLISSDCEISRITYEDSYICVIEDYSKKIGSILTTIDGDDLTEIDEILIVVLIYALGHFIYLISDTIINIAVYINLRKKNDKYNSYFRDLLNKDLDENPIQKERNKFLLYVTIIISLLITLFSTNNEFEDPQYLLTVFLTIVFLICAIFSIFKMFKTLHKNLTLYQYKNSLIELNSYNLDKSTEQNIKLLMLIIFQSSQNIKDLMLIYLNYLDEIIISIDKSDFDLNKKTILDSYKKRIDDYDFDYIKDSILKFYEDFYSDKNVFLSFLTKYHFKTKETNIKFLLDNIKSINDLRNLTFLSKKSIDKLIKLKEKYKNIPINDEVINIFKPVFNSTLITHLEKLLNNMNDLEFNQVRSNFLTNKNNKKILTAFYKDTITIEKLYDLFVNEYNNKYPYCIDLPNDKIEIDFLFHIFAIINDKIIFDFIKIENKSFCEEITNNILELNKNELSEIINLIKKFRSLKLDEQNALHLIFKATNNQIY